MKSQTLTKEYFDQRISKLALKIEDLSDTMATGFKEAKAERAEILRTSKVEFDLVHEKIDTLNEKFNRLVLTEIDKLKNRIERLEQALIIPR